MHDDIDGDAVATDGVLDGEFGELELVVLMLELVDGDAEVVCALPSWHEDAQISSTRAICKSLFFARVWFSMCVDPAA